MKFPPKHHCESLDFRALFGYPYRNIINQRGLEFLSFQALRSAGCLRTLARSSCALDWKDKNSPDVYRSGQGNQRGRNDTTGRHRGDPQGEPTPRPIKTKPPYGTFQIATAYLLVYSTERVSRMTTTLIWPGNVKVSSIFAAMSRLSKPALASETLSLSTITLTSLPA